MSAKKPVFTLDDSDNGVDDDLDLGGLPSGIPPKPNIDEIDRVGKQAGFESREPSRRGRKPSLRTGQIHAKVLPAYSERLKNLSREQGRTQGAILEDALDLYFSDDPIKEPD